MTITTVNKKAAAVKAEPVWTYVLGFEDHPWDKWCTVYCDIVTKSTVVVSEADGIFPYTDENADIAWVGYEWDADGNVWEISYGDPDTTNCKWWEIDDILWGFAEDSYLCWVSADGLVASKDEIAAKYEKSGFIAKKALAKETMEIWWGPVTAADEVKYGLTEAEISEEADAMPDFRNLM